MVYITIYRGKLSLGNLAELGENLYGRQHGAHSAFPESQASLFSWAVMSLALTSPLSLPIAVYVSLRHFNSYKGLDSLIPKNAENSELAEEEI